MKRTHKNRPEATKRTKQDRNLIWLKNRGGCYACRWVTTVKKTSGGSKKLVHQKTLIDDAGLPIRDKIKARAARDKLLAPFAAKKRLHALESIKQQIDFQQTEIKKAEDDRNPPLRISDAWAAYESSTRRPDSGETTLTRYSSQYARFVKWLAGAHPDVILMREVTAGMADSYAADIRAARVSASTFNQHLGFLRLLWRTLASEIRGQESPWNGIERQKLQSIANSRKSITPEQFARLLIAAGESDLRDLLFTIGWTGQRLGDIVLMRWDEVIVRPKLSILQLVPRKTARRTGKTVLVPVLPPLAALLEKRRKKRDGDLVFPDLAVVYLHDPTVLTRRIQKTFEDAGLTPREERAKLKRKVAVYGAHSLRHYFVTQGLAAGWPPQLIRKITGHSSDAMQDHYEHVDVALMTRLAEQLADRPINVAAVGSDSVGKKLLSATAMVSDNALILAKIATIATSMTDNNWKRVKDQIVILAASGSIKSND